MTAVVKFINGDRTASFEIADTCGIASYYNSKEKDENGCAIIEEKDFDTIYGHYINKKWDVYYTFNFLCPNREAFEGKILRDDRIFEKLRSGDPHGLQSIYTIQDLINMVNEDENIIEVRMCPANNTSFTIHGRGRLTTKGCNFTYMPYVENGKLCYTSNKNDYSFLDFDAEITLPIFIVRDQNNLNWDRIRSRESIEMFMWSAVYIHRKVLEPIEFPENVYNRYYKPKTREKIYPVWDL